ncbi:MAG: ATP-binding protein, partial [Bartonella sp.]|nr:ATP-binding protein [Bartonella sp.]
IPTDILDRIFKRFTSHSHHGGRAGAGLGLSLVKSFVELHDGRVEIFTGMGQGTTVKCFFPHQKDIGVV